MVRRLGRYLGVPASSRFRLLGPDRPPATPGDGWDSPRVAQRQDAAWRSLLDQMRAGHPRNDMLALRDALLASGLRAPSLLEVGCGSGYYSEILSHLVSPMLRYAGVDRSAAMLNLARQHYPSIPFVRGDAVRLPFAARAFDIVLNGNALMHILDTDAAVAESVRVARTWCVFHTVPTLEGRPDQYLKKSVYGEAVTEVVLDQARLEGLFGRHGLTIRARYPSIPHPYLDPLVGKTRTWTYLCGN